MSATINSVDLGIVKNESSAKESNLLFFPLPYSDSHEALLIDLMGTGRTITITGEFIGTPAELKTQIENIEAIQNGQQSNSTYNGVLMTGKNVQIQTFNWDYVGGDVGRVVYTLTLMEGSS